MKSKPLNNLSIIGYFWILVISFFFIFTLIYVIAIWRYNLNNSLSILKTQSSRIESSFSETADYTAYIMFYINSRIVEHGVDDPVYIKKLLTSFRLDKNLNNDVNSIIPWNIFSWVNRDMKLTISSDVGVINPIDMSDREHVRDAFKTPNVIHFGNLRIGAISKVLIVPLAMSVTNKNSKVSGAMVFGFYVDRLVNKLNNAVNSKGVSFALFDENLKTILSSESFINNQEVKDNLEKIDTTKDHSGKLTDFKLFSSERVLRYYQKVDKYPYYVVVQYDREVFMNDLLSRLVPYLIQLFLIWVVLFIIVYGFKRLIINPVSRISLISKIIISNSDTKVDFPRSKVREIHQLSKAILSIKKFVKNENDLKKELIKANEDLQSLTRSISHDIRNYIFGIAGLANLILDKKLSDKINQPLDDEDEEMLKIIIHQSEEVGYFVEDLLDHSQIELGNFILKDVTECDVASLINKVLLVNKSFALDNKVKLLFSQKGDVPFLKCDPRRMRQILMNLVSNAIKYNKEEGGEVKITLNVENDYIHIEIADTGIGMSEDEIKMVVKGDGKKIDKNISRKSHIKSHGIGMLTIKHLVELHKGKIKIESENNVGTKVSLWFKADNKDVKNATKAVLDFPNNHKKIKILTVDDNPANLAIMKGILRRQDYKIIEAINGQEAIDILEKEPDINIITMDGKMPIMDGYKTTNIIRSGAGFKNFKNYNIPIIGLMGDADEETVKKAKESGMNKHIQKGASVIDLITIIKSYINKKF